MHRIGKKIPIGDVVMDPAKFCCLFTFSLYCREQNKRSRKKSEGIGGGNNALAMSQVLSIRFFVRSLIVFYGSSWALIDSSFWLRPTRSARWDISSVFALVPKQSSTEAEASLPLRDRVRTKCAQQTKNSLCPCHLKVIQVLRVLNEM